MSGDLAGDRRFCLLTNPRPLVSRVVFVPAGGVVEAFFGAKATSADEREYPPLKTVTVLQCEFPGTVEVLRLADDAI